jgi:hypothetical protein
MPPSLPSAFLRKPVSRRCLPLLLTIAVHLLLAVLYLAQRHTVPPASSAAQRVFVALVARPERQPTPAPVLAPRIRPHVPLAPAARPLPATEATPVSAVDVAPAPPQPAAASDMLAQARRDIGKIDRELRGTAPPLPLLRPDTAQARFERAGAGAGAWIDRSRTMVVDHYQSADGVIIERITRGGGSKCYMSGTVNFVPGILRDSSKPQGVSCPSPRSGWSRR